MVGVLMMLVKRVSDYCQTCRLNYSRAGPLLVRPFSHMREPYHGTADCPYGRSAESTI